MIPTCIWFLSGKLRIGVSAAAAEAMLVLVLVVVIEVAQSWSSLVHFVIVRQDQK